MCQSAHSSKANAFYQTHDRFFSERVLLIAYESVRNVVHEYFLIFTVVHSLHVVVCVNGLILPTDCHTLLDRRTHTLADSRLSDSHTD